MSIRTVRRIGLRQLDTTFVVHCSAFGLPDLLFEMHRCGVHICYPKKMGEFGAVQTVEDNMKLFSKQQRAGAVRDRDLYKKSAVQARDLYKKIISHSTSGFRAIVSAEGVPWSYVTTKDIKAADVIWG